MTGGVRYPNEAGGVLRLFVVVAARGWSPGTRNALRSPLERATVHYLDRFGVHRRREQD